MGHSTSKFVSFIRLPLLVLIPFVLKTQASFAVFISGKQRPATSFRSLPTGDGDFQPFHSHVAQHFFALIVGSAQCSDLARLPPRTPRPLFFRFIEIAFWHFLESRRTGSEMSGVKPFVDPTSDATRRLISAATTTPVERHCESTIIMCGPASGAHSFSPSVLS
ncbi:hypothetical protein PAXRUDRAFT_12363 [Paxillus rubicundulus Ve08.2h10]|uniref:Secreted protein n=1 Tax=Paxillus rubicundulus Ve08.2h10 TaxID=930991 RepID=A0A0D0E183_9AGAM|nr:hypothetical protein PAXRUDRAFT_12363 [Paxillus rubicundulus Ve08.2h10]